MQTVESDIAGHVALKGLRLLDKILDELAATPREDWGKTHVRDVSECVQAAVKYQSEARAQLEFEDQAELSPEDIRAALKAHLANMTATDFRALVADARPELVPVLARAGEPEAHA